MHNTKIISTFASLKIVNMKKYMFIALTLFALTACHESLEDKADREAKEFTKKECPRPMSDGITIDSMTFDKRTRTIHYYFTISGLADTTAIDRSKSYSLLLKAVKGDTSTRKYKENGFNFAYTYFSEKHKGLKLIDFTFTSKEYNEAGKAGKNK